MTTCTSCGRAVAPEQAKQRTDRYGITYDLCRICAIAGAPVGDLEGRLARAPELRPYQRYGVRWLADHYAGLLSDVMGLGKTPQALVAIPEGAPVVVFCPSNVMTNWLTETQTWRPELRAREFMGPRRAWLWPEPGELVTTTYERFPEPAPCACKHVVYAHKPVCEVPDCGCQTYAPGGVGLRPPPEGLVVICDEAHKVKNPDAKRTKRLRWCVRNALARGGRAWLLTATPVLNKPTELWEVLDAAGVAAVAFESKADFKGLFALEEAAERKAERWATPTGERQEEIRRRLRWVGLRRLKKDVLADLPPKQVIERPVQLSLEGAAGIRDSLRDLVAWKRAKADAKRGAVSNPWADGLGKDERAARMAHLRDHAKGVALTLATPTEREIEESLREVFESKDSVAFERLSAVRSALAMAKVPGMLALIEEIEEKEEPLVVFSSHLAPVVSAAARPGWARITGDVVPKERGRIVAAFQRGELKGVALTAGAGAEGITLTAAAYMVQVDLPWTPAISEQAQDRIHRFGQQRGVTIYQLRAEGHVVDAMVDDAIKRKLALIEAIEWAA